MHATDYAAPRISPKIGATSRYTSAAHARYTFNCPPRVLEAKMIADESVLTVGKETFLMIMYRDISVNGFPIVLEQLKPPSIQTFRELWEERRREVPLKLARTFQLETLNL
jgi:hypothetical protein